MTTPESAPDPLDALETALREVAASREVIGHFGAIDAEGSHRSWWSIRYDEAVLNQSRRSFTTNRGWTTVVRPRLVIVTVRLRTDPVSRRR